MELDLRGVRNNNVDTKSIFKIIHDSYAFEWCDMRTFMFVGEATWQAKSR